MKKGFKDPIAIKNQSPKDQPKDGKDSPWDYRCPQYDQRSSSFLNAGTDYGMGYTNPVGSKANSKEFVETLPQGHHSTKCHDKNQVMHEKSE